MAMNILTPENTIDAAIGKMVFLAGSMKDRNGNDWREELINRLTDVDITVFNPSVDDWENKIGEESLDNGRYVNQLRWERLGMIQSDITIFTFSESSDSLITRTEFGLYKDKNSIVWLDGEVKGGEMIKYVCQRYGIPVVETITALENLLRIRISIGE